MLQCRGKRLDGGLAMRILLNLVGMLLVVAFLGYMAVNLNEIPLYIVCILGIGLMLVGARQDRQQEDSKAARLSELD
jgi:hypothetical protein